MFDRLIESDTSDFRPRRRYFIVSSLIVGSLFVSAVIFSIYAAEIGLGNDNLEISAILAPVETPPIAPEPPKPEPQHAQQQEQKQELPMRKDNILRPEETPIEIPPVSTDPNTEMARPDMPFVLGNQNTNPAQPAASGTDPGPATNEVVAAKPAEPVVVSEPKPDPKPEPPRPSAPRHLGVVNGIAINLPIPPYPQPAIAMHLEGKVDVQVTIDERGSVMSAKAASGHVFLRGPAESAAKRARFTPTILNGNPVKVTGVIVYNFTRN
jgi:periplasmic protein TonB